MKITETKIGENYTVVKLHTQGSLRQRFISFGILKGVTIRYMGRTSLKGTYEIRVGKMSIALREQEANKIEVKKYEND
ncbi:MAG: hypothetical protein B1H07_01810 [Campylobacteraceae bacterium 4484_166]|nr:MAG: hypothetical protein B1H07_01810 [Campylobacteraceae bacterium 4484_166]